MINEHFFPPVEPFANGKLKVDDLHTLYWEQCGRPDGVPILFLHGGPGAGCSEADRRFFDPARFRVVLFDQRGRPQGPWYAGLSFFSFFPPAPTQEPLSEQETPCGRREQQLNHEDSNIRVGRWWDLVIGVLVPIQALVLGVLILLNRWIVRQTGDKA